MILLQSLKIELSLRNSRQWMHLGTHSPSLPAPPPLAFGLCVPSALLFVYLLLISPCYHFPMMRGTCFISASSSSFLTGFSLLCECFFLVPLQYISFPFSSFCSLLIFWLLLLPPSSYYFSYYHSLKTTNWKGNIFIRIYCTYHMCSIFFLFTNRWLEHFLLLLFNKSKYLNNLLLHVSISWLFSPISCGVGRKQFLQAQDSAYKVTREIIETLISLYLKELFKKFPWCLSKKGKERYDQLFTNSDY